MAATANFHAEIKMHKTEASQAAEKSHEHFPAPSPDNDIITSKIWLFDYKNFKMKTDEFPLLRQDGGGRNRNNKKKRKKKFLLKAQYLKIFLLSKSEKLREQ